MKPLSFKRHRFPAEVIRHAVWLYFRFSLSLRDVEELLAARGIDVSYETIRCWTIKFGPQIARRLKRQRPPPSPRWHLDEMVCSIGGKRMYLWRAVDDEGEVLDLVVQRRRDTEAALTLLKRLLRNQRVEPQRIVTDGLGSYPAALDQLGLRHLHSPGRLRENNRAENSHLPIRRRERQQQLFKWCCQSNANLSPVDAFGAGACRLSGKCLPLGKGSRSPGFEVVSADEVAVLVEVVVEGGVDGAELLQGLHLAEAEHGAFSPSERQM